MPSIAKNILIMLKNALKTVLKRKIRKTAQAAGELSENEISDKISY